MSHIQRYHRSYSWCSLARRSSAVAAKEGKKGTIVETTDPSFSIFFLMMREKEKIGLDRDQMPLVTTDGVVPDDRTWKEKAAGHSERMGAWWGRISPLSPFFFVYLGSQRGMAESPAPHCKLVPVAAGARSNSDRKKKKKRDGSVPPLLLLLLFGKL